MEDNIWINGPIELLRHGLKHIERESDFDNRIAMISIDNAVETSIKIFLSLNRRSLNISYKIYKNSIQKFPSKLNLLQKYVPDKVSNNELDAIEMFHKIRNSLYHQGTGITVLLNVVNRYAIVAKDLISRLFNVNFEEKFQDIRINDLSDKYDEFLITWRDIEVNLKNFALVKGLAPKIPRPINIRNVIDLLVSNNFLTKDFGMKVRKMLEMRNKIIHSLKDFKIGEIQEINERLKEIYEELIILMNQ